MNFLFYIIFLTAAYSAYCDSSNIKGIYGLDDRVMASSYKNYMFKSLAKSVAALVDNDNIEYLYLDKIAKITGLNYKDRYNMCSGQKFNNKLTTSHCSGFLIDKDILVTAGHCIEDLYDCSQSSWVFDFEAKRVQVDGHYHTLANNIYTCVEVLAHEYTFTQKDYTVVRLNKKVKDRRPLEIRSSGKISDKNSLVMIGHPRGLPMIITDNALVIDNENKNYFITNLDAFQGNSGGPVFNSGTGLVEGLLVRGGADHYYDFDNDCYLTFLCGVHGDCAGEEVMRITSIPLLKNHIKK